MYMNYTITDTIRVPPADIGGKLKEILLKQAKEVYEGVMDEDIGVIIAVTEIGNIGDGKIVPGDGAAYYETDVGMIAYKPQVHELVEGEISDVTEFGAFIKTGPLEGLIHVSQIMDDYINYDAKLPGFVGKETKRKLTVKDVVKARIVTVSLKGTISSSKIGLTMRQEGLGKDEWAKLAEKSKKTPPKGNPTHTHEGAGPRKEDKKNEKKEAKK
ncbi:MAG: DNA-directed RNA polymerase [archaeon]|nr:DNA-directed RNA polymerase [archaeon]